MKYIPIALFVFVAPAFAEELPIDPDVKEATIASTICKPGWIKSVRPSLHEWNRIKREKLLAAGLPEAECDFRNGRASHTSTHSYRALTQLYERDPQSVHDVSNKWKSAEQSVGRYILPISTRTRTMINTSPRPPDG